MSNISWKTPLRISFYLAIWNSNFLSKAFPQCYKQIEIPPTLIPTPTKMGLGLPSGTQLPAHEHGSISKVPERRPSDMFTSPPHPPESPWIFKPTAEVLGSFYTLTLERFVSRFWS